MILLPVGKPLPRFSCKKTTRKPIARSIDEIDQFIRNFLLDCSIKLTQFLDATMVLTDLTSQEIRRDR
jgi:hypothetical protein